MAQLEAIARVDKITLRHDTYLEQKAVHEEEALDAQGSDYIDDMYQHTITEEGKNGTPN